MNEVKKIENTFGVQKEIANGHSTQVGAAREMAEVQAQVVMAKQFPRDIVAVVDRIINECTRKELAEQASYAYPKGGQIVTGPSIRLAETIARNWGNMDFGIKEVDQVNGVSIVKAYAWDLETNVKQSKEFKVSHMRHTKRGSYKLEDPRDIYELVANQGARRLRACILGVIPGDVVKAGEQQCALTLESKADVTPDGIQKLLEAFEKFGIDKELIEKRIGSRMDAIRPAQLIQLRQIYIGLRDGMTKPNEWFDIPLEKPKFEQPDKVKSDLFEGQEEKENNDEKK